MACPMGKSELPQDVVLIFAPTGRDAATTSGLLQRVGISTRICPDFDTLLAEIDHDAGVAFVAEEGLFGQALDKLAARIQGQPAWSDIPFVMLTSRHDNPRVAAWRKTQTERLGNVSLIERPVQPITLVSVMQAALRARKRQFEIRTLLLAREAAATQLESLVATRTEQLQTANTQLRDEMTERARVEDTLRHAQKLEALGQLTGGVAHDFNNLLMVITAGLDMLELRDDPERREKLVRAMQQAAQRGASLTRQLLAFSRSRALQPETVDLSKLLGNMSELLDRSLRGDITVQVELADDLWPIVADPGELELVILNLAVNARDAMRGSGVITIAGRNVRQTIDGVEGEFVSLSVHDTGSGMSDEIKARVFEPFFTTKDVGKGSGLGLAQVYGFAKQSGGAVTIDSVVDEGTRITLSLPRSHGVALQDAYDRRDVARFEPDADRCVLLVEDDVEVAALVEQMLRGLGYDVVHATGANAALGALANDRRIDLVFSDIMMPGGTNGIALAKQIRTRRPALPVLLTSGFSEAMRGEAEALGIPILHKPYGLNELRDAVARELAGRALS